MAWAVVFQEAWAAVFPVELVELVEPVALLQPAILTSFLSFVGQYSKDIPFLFCLNSTIWLDQLFKKDSSLVLLSYRFVLFPFFIE